MTFRRVMFWLLVPAVALVAHALSGLLFLAAPSEQSTAFIFVCFGYVLLGSMTLNAWLALRRPESLSLRALPVGLAIVQAALYLSGALWLLGLFQATTRDRGFVGETHPGINLALLVSIPLMGLSIAGLVLIVRRETYAATKITQIRLTARFVVGCVAFIVLAASTAACYLLLRTADNDGFWTFALMLAGLPWSHTQYFVTALPLSLAGAQPFITSTMLLPIAVNIGLAIELLASSRFRTRAVNWFFRLDRRPKPDADAAAEDF